MLQKSNVTVVSPMVQKCLLEGDYGFAEISSFGILDSCTLYPGDRLILAIASGASGSVCLMQDSTKEAGFTFSRKYGNHYLHIPTSKPMNTSRWEVLGYVVAIERKIGAPTCLDGNTYVAIFGGSSELNMHFYDQKTCDPAYISELSRYLSHEYPAASCIVASHHDLLELDIEIFPII